MPKILPIADAINSLNEIMPTLENDSENTRNEILVFKMFCQGGPFNCLLQFNWGGGG